MLEKIAFQKKLISKEDCIKAMKACRSSDDYENALKRFFIENNLISEETITQLINTSAGIKILQSTIRFGSLAVKMRFISEKTLKAALAFQKRMLTGNKQPKMIGQILLEAGKLTRQQIEQVMEEQKRIKQTGIKSSRNEPEPAPNKPVPDVPEPETDKPEADEPEADKPESVEESIPQSESIEGGLLLDIEDHGMTAYLRKTNDFDSNFIPEDIYSILSAKGIHYGLANESAVEGFINSSGFQTNRFKAAQGTPREKGRDGRIEYYFDTDHLKAGGMDEKGNIDFKERGEIPRTKAHQLLAEKFDFEEARPGRDIFGSELPVRTVKDVVLNAGEGVSISEDGKRAFSQISGHPKLSWSGSISVEEFFQVKEDVGYKTGHLVYDGNIHVNGCLKSGFKIKGNDVKIKEIDGGEIYAQGDVKIMDGANGAKIFAKGHVTVNFIHDSHISCLGNVYVEKEIVDSTIENSGACQVKTGKIINSKICSNQGVHVKNIGTDKTDPSTIIVGRDVYVKNELIRIEKQIIESEKEKNKLKKKQQNLRYENEWYQQSAIRVANEIDKVTGDRRRIENSLKELENRSKDKKEILNLKTLLKQKQALYSRLNDNLNERFNVIETNEAQIKKVSLALDGHDDLINDLNAERENYLDWEESNPGKSEVIAEGKVLAGTIVHGRHAQRELKEIVSNARIKECKLSNQGDNTNLFEIQIHDNIKKR